MLAPLEIGLSFLEGLALIASPCILPVLPLVLGASLDGGRKRPFGIIIGFVLAFSAFALFSRALVSTLGINLDSLKNASLVLLAVFGCVLLSTTLSDKFSAATQRFANMGNRLSSKTDDGLLSGILIGLLIGVVWTPCAGPLLAVALVQIIRQESDAQALALIVSFAMGAGIPMLLISLMGRKAMTKLNFFAIHAQKIRKGFGVIILLAVAFIASGLDAQTLFTNPPQPSVITETGLQDALEKPYPAPEFTGIQEWLNSNPRTMASLKGKLVLIDFWTYSCINCIRTLPYITKWDATYRDKGLVIIGIHAPEFEFEKNVDNVRAALKKHGIQYPVAVDNRLDTWTAFQNRYWPAHYLINQQGQVVYTHFGEGNYAQTENNIRHLLGLDKKMETAVAPQPFSRTQTPETYLGYGRGDIFSGTIQQTDGAFTPPKFLPTDNWSLSGKWAIKQQYIVSLEKGATLQLNFTAKKVFLVLGAQDGKTIPATLTLNGLPLGTSAGKDVVDGIVTVKNHTLYELVNQNKKQNGLLEITAGDAGLEGYAFTFGE